MWQVEAEGELWCHTSVFGEGDSHMYFLRWLRKTTLFRWIEVTGDGLHPLKEKSVVAVSAPMAKLVLVQDLSEIAAAYNQRKPKYKVNSTFHNITWIGKIALCKGFKRARSESSKDRDSELGKVVLDAPVDLNTWWELDVEKVSSSSSPSADLFVEPSRVLVGSFWVEVSGMQDIISDEHTLMDAVRLSDGILMDVVLRQNNRLLVKIKTHEPTCLRLTILDKYAGVIHVVDDLPTTLIDDLF